MPAPSVRLERVSRRFGPVLANDDVTLDLVPDEIHAIVGENGAGKTTLMRVLYGLVPPDSGTIRIDGRVVRLKSPVDAMRHGLGMVHQHFMLVDTLRVFENVTLGLEPRRGLDRLDVEQARRRVRELSDRYGLPADPDARVRDLSVGAQQRIEILKALHHGARVLILDEPTAVLTPQEVDDLFAALRNLQREGTTIVLITHKLAEVMALADRVTVMRGGRVVGGGPVRDFTVASLAELMVGRPMSPSYDRVAVRSEVPLLEARLLDVEDDRGLPAVRGVSFTVHGGEIVGIAGVEGNGQHELVECLSGLRAQRHGEVRIGDRTVPAGHPREHTIAGLAHIPADRLKRGIVPAMTLGENLILGCQRDPELGNGSRLDPELVEARAARLLTEYDVRPPDPQRLASTLSGGNQQKLVVARELSREALAVIAAHPTRGVDLGAVAAIHARLLAARAAGRAVLLVSSELSEILALSDRIFVIAEGRLVHETTPGETDERTLGLFMCGHDRRQA